MNFTNNWYGPCISIVTVNSKHLHGQLDSKSANIYSVDCANFIYIYSIHVSNA